VDLSQAQRSERLDPIRVLFIAAEAAPFIKVGGLGDVAGSLPPALRALDPQLTGGRPLDVRLVIPFHGEIQKRMPNPELVADYLVDSSQGAVQAQAFLTLVGDLPVYLIGGPPFRPDVPVYSLNTEEDGEKYIFFSLAALGLAKALNWQPDLIHANDWHAALSLYALCRSRGQEEFFQHTRSLISIHNLPFMGGGTERAMANYSIPPTQTRRLPRWARSFPLPLGLLAADRIVAVSPTYGAEIQTPEFGCGLQDFLKRRAADGEVTGILNGLDMNAWNPAEDVTLAAPFTAQTLVDRAENKAALQEEVGLAVEADTPLLIFIGRMDPQKGIDLAIDGLREMSELPWQIIFLGTGVPLLESAARSLEVEFPDRVRALIRFDPQLARQMYAGGDILLMPSRYEPCGLAQMIAMRYGCAPLARATGGLKDTVVDIDLSPTGTGFLFDDATPAAFIKALRRAITHYNSQIAWQAMQQNGMALDFSWQRSAVEYARIYSEIREEFKP
jgi:starch synthase